MKNLLLRLLAGAAATALAVLLVPGITLTGADNTSKAVTLLVVAGILGLVNAVIRPLVKALGFCLVVLTLGLFLLVINALMLMLTSNIAGHLGLGFHVDGFWPAFFGALIISVAGALVGSAVGVKK